MALPEDTEILPPIGDGPRLPALGAPELSVEFLAKLKEIVEVMLGRRGGSQWSRAVTFRDLANSGGNSQAQAIIAGSIAGMLEAELRKSAAFKELTRRIGGAEDLASYPEEIRQQLSLSLGTIARARQADIQSTDRKIQNSVTSMASRILELTAALNEVAAGVRHFDAAYADRATALAVSLTQVTARLDGAGGPGVTVEEKLLAQADMLTGLLGQWSIKIQAGSEADPVMAGISLSLEDPVAGPATSSLIFMTDKFGMVTPSGKVFPFSADAFGLNINGLLRVNGVALEDIASGDPVPGPPGTRGNVDIGVVTTGTAWSDSEAVAGLSAAGYGAPIQRDVVTLYKTDRTFAKTKVYISTSWVDVAGIIDGNLLVKNSVLAEHIDARSIVLRDGAGNPIIGLGVPLAAGYEAPGTKNSDIVVGGRNLYSRTTPLYDIQGGATVPGRLASGFQLHGVAGSAGVIRMGTIIPKNGVYTISFDVAVDSSAGYPLTLDFCDGTTGTQASWVVNPTTATQHVSHTFDISNWSSAVYNFIDFNGLSNQNYFFTNFKVEVGNKESGWTPSPEDVAADAQAKATAAQAAAATDATSKANAAQAAAIAAAATAAQAKADLAETTAKAYADGIVTDEEERAIADATAKANAAQAAAIAAAAADATAKANAVAAAANAALADKLSKSAANVLAGGAGLTAGTLTYNSSGVRTGGYGVALNSAGIVGFNSSGVATFAIDASTGDATFGGTVTASAVIAGTLAGTVAGNAASGAAAGAKLDNPPFASNPTNISINTSTVTVAVGNRTASVTGGTAPFTYLWTLENTDDTDPESGYGIRMDGGGGAATVYLKALSTGAAEDYSVIARCAIRDASGLTGQCSFTAYVNFM